MMGDECVDFKHNIAGWLSGDNRVLFIVGLAGSGKTTLSKEYMELRKGSTIIHTDEVDRSFRVGRESLDTDTYCKELVNDILKRFYGPIIIEGVHVLACDKSLLKDESVVIKGTSLAVSNMRAIRRDLMSEGLVHLLVLFKDNMDFNKRINDLRDYLRK